MVRFLIIGGWNTVFGLATFTFIWWWLGEEVGYVATLLMAQVIAVVQSHATQRRFVWRSRGPYLAELSRFSVVYSLGLLLNLVLLAVAVDVFHLPVLASQVVITALVIVAQFAAQRLWAFRSGLALPAGAGER